VLHTVEAHLYTHDVKQQEGKRKTNARKKAKRLVSTIELVLQNNAGQLGIANRLSPKVCV